MRGAAALVVLTCVALAYEDWPVAGGNAARNRVARDLAPDLPPKPIWRHRLAERDARLSAVGGKWFRLARGEVARSAGAEVEYDGALVTVAEAVRKTKRSRAPR